MFARRAICGLGGMLLLGQVAEADRLTLPPFCNNAYAILSPGDTRKIQIEDGQTRELLILQAIGPEGMQTVQKAIKLPPLHKVETEAEALAIVERMMDDPTAYQPVLKILQDLPPAQSWALYLNSGFHAVSTHTDGHREMVQQAIAQFPKSGVNQTDPYRIVDVGIGNGNLVAAAAIRDPKQVVYGLDVAGAGLNISTHRLNQITELTAAKNGDPFVSNTGRFWVGRGNATDPHIFNGQKFDAGSMVLTLFAIPTAQRKAALKNIYDSLEPGARFVLIDPLPRANDPAAGRKFLREIVRNAYQNNTDLTALDIALLTVKNAHQLLKTDFLSVDEQRTIGEDVGFKPLGPSQLVYYDCANMTVFEKPAH